MFEKATKQKLRFDSPMGHLSVEDVWDLPLQHRSRFSLDVLARTINRELKEQEEESFVSKPTQASETLKLKFDIVKHIIDVRLAEVDAKEKAQKDKQRRETVLAVIERKENQQLEDMPLEELKKLV